MRYSQSVSERAPLSLTEQIEQVTADLEQAEGQERHQLIAELAWLQARRGDLGAAFATLWEPEETLDPGHVRELMRAELQAVCGNEDAALALIVELEPSLPGVSLVRSRVAASRGDWDAALRWAEQARRASELSDRAGALASRARDEIDRAGRVLGEAAEATLRAAAHRARADGALLSEADVWADLSALQNARGDEEGARRSAARAVELWDDMLMTLPPPLRAGFWLDARRQLARAASQRSTRRGGPHAVDPSSSLLRSLRRLTRERDLEKLLALITDGAVAISGAERGFVLLVDERGALEPKTIRGAQAELGEPAAAFSRSIAETVLIDREPVITVDAAHDARVQDYMSVHQLMLKSVACLPIEAGGRTWGVLYLEHRSASGRFSGTDLSILRAFADQAAIAIETAHLIAQVGRQKKELEEANEALREANRQLEHRLHGQGQALERTRRQIAALGGSTAVADRWGLVGVSDAMKRVYDILDRVCANEVPVVVTGESGTGKELVARAIHRGGTRHQGPYVSLNCGAIPEGLLESELFGHVAGAFTGATCARDGIFLQANGGTLFMDEIADMPPRMQMDLLRVLQEHRVRRVGSVDDQPVDVRIITASKRPLRELVDQGLLREDLYYRLAVVEIPLPPLRERRNDIALLCDHFLSRIANERGEPKKLLTRGAAQRLAAHDFPGNVRELEHLLINACVLSAGSTIDADDLSIEASSPPIRGGAELGSYRDFKDAERERILAALNAHDWNRAQAARSLGMARRTFYRRLKQHRIGLPKDAT